MRGPNRPLSLRALSHCVVVLTRVTNPQHEFRGFQRRTLGLRADRKLDPNDTETNQDTEFGGTDVHNAEIDR